MPLHNDRQELGRFTVQCLHGVFVGGIEIDRIACFQFDFVMVDPYFHPTFQDKVEFLPGMGVWAGGVVAGSGGDRDQKGSAFLWTKLAARLR